MNRLTLRLARPCVLASVALLAAVALYAVLTRRAMSTDLDTPSRNQLRRWRRRAASATEPETEG